MFILNNFLKIPTNDTVYIEHQRRRSKTSFYAFKQNDHLVKKKSVTRFGYSCKVLAANYLTKVAQIFADL